MKKLPFISLLLFAAGAASLPAAPIKVSLLVESEALRADITRCGAEIVAPADAGAADVIVLQRFSHAPPPGTDRAALEAFAKKGGGLVVIGGAIATGDATWWKPLAGGAWTADSRKFRNLMMLHALADAHPITRDASPFDLDDETPYDLDTDPAIRVLASAFTPKVTGARRDNRAPERPDRANVYDLQPQMWTFEGAADHRAFVLLPGAAATLDHPSIRTFILRGIAWAAKREPVDELCPPDDATPLRYPKDGPRTAADTVKSFDLMPGFRATVVASEPLINKPIAIQWDARGRLWVAETPEYPNGRRPLSEASWKETGALEPGRYDRPATDRISILDDTDGDGVMDRKTVFHSGLELVTGFCLWRDGVIAVGQPDIVYIHGEGAAQRVDRLFAGFSPADTHFVANHFVAAPDGWIYANTGSGAAAESVTHPGVKARIGSGVFRFKPDGSAIEMVGSKGGNAFGLDVTSDGEVFCGQATSGNPVQHVALPEWVLARGRVGGAGSLESVIDHRKVVRSDMPRRVPYMQIDVVGGYSAACASTVYEGGAWPAPWNDTVFCTEPILDVVHFEKLRPKGTGFTGEMTEPGREWLRAQDFWFFPIDVQFGPDGAAYLLDFYAPIVAHNDTRGPQHGRAGASIRPDRDHYFGRIYRIQHEAAKKLESLDLTRADAAGLVRAFSHPNKGVRFNAHRLLLDRADAADAVPALDALARSEPFAPARILALWALHRLDRLTPPTLELALKAEDAGVRKSALLICESAGTNSPADVTALLRDPDPRVRLTALRALSSTALTPAGATALLAVMPTLEDSWSRSAATAAASSNPGPILEAALSAGGTPGGAQLDLAGALARRVVERGDSATLARILIAAAAAPSENATLVRVTLEAAAGRLPPAPAPEPNLDAALTALLSSRDDAIAAAALPFAAAWDTGGDARRAVADRISANLLLIADPARSDDARSSAVLGLLRARSADARVWPAVTALLKTPLSDPLKADVISALAATGEPALGRILAALLPELSPLTQNVAFDALVSRAGWANALLDAVESGALKPALLGPMRWSKLRTHPDPVVAGRATAVQAAAGGGANTQKEELVAKLLPEIEGKPGDATKGKALFTGACALCHTFNGDGKVVGPVLDGMGVHGVAELLIHILDPNRAVDNEHRTWNIALRNGTFATGLIARENDDALTLRLPGGIEQDIRIADIKTRRETGVSLMPEGFEALGPDGLRDLLAYLGASDSKYRALTLGDAFTADTRGGLYHSRAATKESVHPVKFGIVTVEGVPFTLPDPAAGARGNVIVLKNNDSKTFASTMPQRVNIPVGFAAGNLHFLGGVAGWGGGPDFHKPAMKVTLEFADGKKQVEELYTGDVFLDYVRSDEVPGSKRVKGITKQWHVRYFSLPVNERAAITNLALESYLNGISPTTLAITADHADPLPRRTTSGLRPPAQRPAGGPRVLLVGGGGSHDYNRFFRDTDKATLTAVQPGWLDYTDQAADAVRVIQDVDVLVWSSNRGLSDEAAVALKAWADAGKPLVLLHPGVWYNWPRFPAWNKELVGGGARSHDAITEFEVKTTDIRHPVLAGVSASFRITDELYHVIPDPQGTPIEILATATSPRTGTTFPSVWIVKHPKARIVCIAPGHDGRAHDHPDFKRLLQNAVGWAAGD